VPVKSTARDRRIRQANLRVIEAEIRNYHQTVRDLRELEEAVALPGAVGDPAEHVVRTQPGDPTPARAHRMMTSTQLLEIRRRVEAIEYMLRVVKASPEPARYKLIELAYWDGRYTVMGICDRLKISERTYYRWRREILGLVAEKLGWEI
jgi:RinA family phage transcriptional activator